MYDPDKPSRKPLTYWALKQLSKSNCPALHCIIDVNAGLYCANVAASSETLITLGTIPSSTKLMIKVQ